MKCSKRNCQNIGKYIFSKYKNQIYYYCEQHYRFKEMSHFANKNHNIKLTSAEIEKIYIQIFGHNKNPKCLSCGKTMTWHSKYTGRADVISLQHWEVLTAYENPTKSKEIG